MEVTRNKKAPRFVWTFMFLESPINNNFKPLGEEIIKVFFNNHMIMGWMKISNNIIKN